MNGDRFVVQTAIQRAKTTRSQIVEQRLDMSASTTTLSLLLVRPSARAAACCCGGSVVSQRCLSLRDHFPDPAPQRPQRHVKPWSLTRRAAHLRVRTRRRTRWLLLFCSISRSANKWIERDTPHQQRWQQPPGLATTTTICRPSTMASPPSPAASPPPNPRHVRHAAVVEHARAHVEDHRWRCS